jgi:hypothetical protein
VARASSVVLAQVGAVASVSLPFGFVFKLQLSGGNLILKTPAQRYAATLDALVLRLAVPVLHALLLLLRQDWSCSGLEYI